MIRCPSCEDGKIEVSTKVYYDVTEGEIENIAGEDVVVIRAMEHSPLNDTLDGEPFNMEAELFVGCDGCGREFEVSWDDVILHALDRQQDRHFDRSEPEAE